MYEKGMRNHYQCGCRYVALTFRSACAEFYDFLPPPAGSKTSMLFRQNAFYHFSKEDLKPDLRKISASKVSPSYLFRINVCTKEISQ